MITTNTTEKTNNQKWLETALSYLKFGFSVIPIGLNKQPLISWKEYQTRKPTEVELNSWSNLENLQGIAVITGKISGVFVLDIDEGGKIEELPLTSLVRTGSGLHYYFKYPDNFEVKNRTGLRPKVDIRGEGGYAILPPTIHQNGKEYIWLLNLTTPIAQAPEWLLKEIQGKGGNSNPDVSLQIYEGVEEGSRNSVATHIIGKLLAHLPPQDWLPVVWPLLQAWNDKNSPPLKIQELSIIFNSISSRELNNPSFRHPIYSNDEVTDDFSFFTLKELMENEAVKTSWLVDHLIPENGITCLAARMKTGKSFLTLQIAQSLTQGTDLFGKFKVKKTGVLIINKEDPEGLIKERLNQLHVDKNLPIIFSTDQRIFFHKDRCLPKILDLTKKHNIGLVIADPFRMLFKGDENSSMEIRPIHQSFKNLTQKGLTILFVHHYGKDSEGKDDGDKLRGSSGIGAMVDSAIALKRTDDDKFLKVIQLECRFSRKYPPFVLNFPTFENDDFQFNFLNSVESEETLQDKTRVDILNVLTKFGPILNVKEIESLLKEKSLNNSSHGTICAVLRELKLTKQLLDEQKGTCRYYFLPKSHSSISHPINTSDEVTKGS